MPDVWRVTLPDINDMAEFLLGRLRQKYDGATDRAIMGWLAEAIESADYHFVRTTHAFALAMVRARPLEKPVVRVLFCIAVSKEHDNAAAVLFQAFGRWAADIGAGEVEIDDFTDVGKAGIDRHLGALKHRKLYVVVAPFGEAQPAKRRAA